MRILFFLLCGFLLAQASTLATLERVRLDETNSRLVLEFNQQLATSDIHTFSINKKSLFKKVLDIKSINNKRSFFLKPKALKALRVARYKKSITRVVFEDSKKLSIDHTIKGKSLYISYGKSSPLKKSLDSNKKIVQSSDKVIVIDVGHGGKDGGALGHKKRKEKSIVLAVSKKIKKELRKLGYRHVYLTRERDSYISLKKRTSLANRKKADIFISIHANAAPTKKKKYTAKGIETFFLSPARSERSKKVAEKENSADLNYMNDYSQNIYLNFLNTERIVASNKLAIDIHRNLIASTRSKFNNVKDGGVREAPFWVLVGAQMPSVLIELGYISHPTESTRLVNPSYQNLLAKGVAKGINSYFAKN